MAAQPGNFRVGRLFLVLHKAHCCPVWPSCFWTAANPPV